MEIGEQKEERKCLPIFLTLFVRYWNSIMLWEIVRDVIFHITSQLTMWQPFRESRDYQVACSMITWCRHSWTWVLIKRLLPEWLHSIQNLFFSVSFLLLSSLVRSIYFVRKGTHRYWADAEGYLQTSHCWLHDSVHDSNWHLLSLGNWNHGGIESFRWFGRCTKEYTYWNDLRNSDHKHCLPVMCIPICWNCRQLAVAWQVKQFVPFVRFKAELLRLITITKQNIKTLC